MDILLISIHSVLRWLMLFALLYSIYNSFAGWAKGRAFSKTDNRLRVITASLAHLQLIVGLLVYYMSASVHYLFRDFSAAVKDSQVRFFGMEHSVLMLLAIILITVGSVLSRRRTEDRAKFRSLSIWFSAGLIIILFAIPWPFIHTVGRPLFRMF